ncbi:hypothetical protein [Rhodococcus wratislaviensis]|uniref:Uncharacterized protein n=1 Tax=Rhodococcus wratislaviensis NBRC 100605 TaxID=1219028 RepID=X0PYW9_RHOWR|nr:hypothetical protein [Rhodococcus wratislaviensis]GAF48824.1 hypothetical protein RW1_060_00330 [Rhodococcus wratislaviensis NBRC 100605]
MDAAWHLIQYTADLRRKEPRNVGVVAQVDGEWAIRMFAVDGEDQSVNGHRLRTLRLTKDGYENWVRYYHRLTESGSWDEILRHQARRPSEFTVRKGGFVSTQQSASDLVQRLYNELVETADHSVSRAKLLQAQVESVLTIAEIAPAVEVAVPARWDRGTQAEQDDSVPFNYAYTNGQQHLMDRLQLHQNSVSMSTMIARDFNARVTAASAARTAESFIAFYSGEAIDEMGSDAMLTPIFKVAHIVDVDDPEAAADSLLGLMHPA